MIGLARLIIFKFWFNNSWKTWHSVTCFKTCKIRGIWFCCFLFSFSLEIKNGDENVFGWIFENIFNKNIFSNQPKNEINKISFSVFSVSFFFFTPSNFFHMLLSTDNKPNSVSYASLSLSLSLSLSFNHIFSSLKPVCLTPLFVDPAPPHHYHCSAAPLLPQHHSQLTISWWDLLHVSFFLIFLLHESINESFRIFYVLLISLMRMIILHFRVSIWGFWELVA